MLIISIPKSASTSLRSTLGTINCFESVQLRFNANPRPFEFSILSDFHSDIRELTQNDTKIFSQNNIIYKQHIPPTNNNLYLLKNLKKVVLLREPKDIIEAYYRARQKRLSRNLGGMIDNSTLEEWIKSSEQNGLLEELNTFYKLWHAEQGENCLILQYKDLIENTKYSINLIHAFCDLPLITENIILEKKRFTRQNLFQDFLQNQIKSIKKHLKKLRH
jgi:predicted DNA-binding protein (MmcQ/YjbR family)